MAHSVQGQNVMKRTPLCLLSHLHRLRMSKKFACTVEAASSAEGGLEISPLPKPKKVAKGSTYGCYGIHLRPFLRFDPGAEDSDIATAPKPLPRPWVFAVLSSRRALLDLHRSLVVAAVWRNPVRIPMPDDLSSPTLKADFLAWTMRKKDGKVGRQNVGQYVEGKYLRAHPRYLAAASTSADTTLPERF